MNGVMTQLLCQLMGMSHEEVFFVPTTMRALFRTVIGKVQWAPVLNRKVSVLYVTPASAGRIYKKNQIVCLCAVISRTSMTAYYASMSAYYASKTAYYASMTVYYASMTAYYALMTGVLLCNAMAAGAGIALFC